MKKLNVAIIGQGRSGKDIHGRYMLSPHNVFFDVKYIVESNERRRAISREMYPGCEIFENYTELFGKKDIDLVVNATYSYMHYGITKDLLSRKFNVLVEKPFARNRFECDDLIKTAKENGVLLAVFQQTFFAPFYRNILELCESGILGDILQATIRYSVFSRRWDWQTLQKTMGGNAYNTGPHPFGIALGILGFDENVEIAFSRLDCSKMSAGDYDDYCKVILVAPHKPVVDVEINNTDAYTGYNVKLQGTKGCFKCTTTDYEYRYIIEGENPERIASETFISDADGNPIYCGEKLVYHEENGKYEGTAFDVGTQKMYENIYYALTEGRDLYVTPENAAEIIRVIETVHANNPLKRKF